MELQYRKNDKTGEELYYTTHSSGLGIYIIPKKDQSKTYAIFGTRYGSVDSKFVVPGERELTEVPDGIAHYLEHKMFDQPDGSNVFDKFYNENILNKLEYVAREHMLHDETKGVVGRFDAMFLKNDAKIPGVQNLLLIDWKNTEKIETYADKILQISIQDSTQNVILRMRSVNAIDATAMHSLEQLFTKCRKKNVHLIFSHVNEQPMSVMRKAGFDEKVGKDLFCAHIDEALQKADDLQ